MVFTNAEKQKRWRQRRNARAERNEAMLEVLAPQHSKLSSMVESLTKENTLLRQAISIVYGDLALIKSRSMKHDDNIEEIDEVICRCMGILDDLGIFDELPIGEGSQTQQKNEVENEGPAKTQKECRDPHPCDAGPNGRHRSPAFEGARPGH